MSEKILVLPDPKNHIGKSFGIRIDSVDDTIKVISKDELILIPGTEETKSEIRSSILLHRYVSMSFKSILHNEIYYWLWLDIIGSFQSFNNCDLVELKKTNDN